MLDKQKLTGIGTLNFLGANQLIINDEFAGLSLMYMAVHGEDDRKGMDNPVKEEQFIEEFNKIFNGQ